MRKKIREYQDWLELQYDLARDAEVMFTAEEPPRAEAATKAKFHAKGFKEAMEEFNRLFPMEEE